MRRSDSPAIAIVGMACEFPDASSPRELWNNTLARRRAFRRIPPERLRLEDYAPGQTFESDSLYCTHAALIRDYKFNRSQFRISRDVYRSADLSHWLALDVASRALIDAGFAEGEGLDRKRTGVIIGNSLTGEFSRAENMRLRWPYVRRALAKELSDEGWSGQRLAEFLNRMELRYKLPFAKVGEDSLSGGLSNTIAGRVCNHYDFGGGGFTIDGACSSSLLAVANACRALVAGEIDVALAGGVDLSIDPFELVGFSRIGALAKDEMRVYNERPTGFWPGEGCGFAVLMDFQKAAKQDKHIYAVIRGWGISSDGSGGLTRPDVNGQKLALERAYQLAGYDFSTNGYVEGHGTGTNIGDEVELQMLASARNSSPDAKRPLAVGSIKTNIGHCKAAAGAAGLQKVTLAVSEGIIPPSIGAEAPHKIISENPHALRLPSDGETWNTGEIRRAGVSSMGFGGINVHVALENVRASVKTTITVEDRIKLGSFQDHELLVIAAANPLELKAHIAQIQESAATLSMAELADLGAALGIASAESESHTARAALVASTVDKAVKGLKTLLEWLDDGITQRIEPTLGVFLSCREGDQLHSPSVLFLFSGECVNADPLGGALRRRFIEVLVLYVTARLPDGPPTEIVPTDIAQPSIVTASLAALSVFARVGLDASAAVGHSLGELTALRWAGACDDQQLIDLSRFRGKVMADCNSQKGAMASLRAPAERVSTLLDELNLKSEVVIAGINTPKNTVISGAVSAIDEALQSAQSQGIPAVKLAVSHAFHSHLVEPSAGPLKEYVQGLSLRALRKTVYSTVSGTKLDEDPNIADLLCRQMSSPVRFVEAFQRASESADLIIEVGPGQVLSSMAAQMTHSPCIATDASSESLGGTLKGIGAAWTLGADLHIDKLFSDRYVKPYDFTKAPVFFANPCEKAPVLPPSEATSIGQVINPDVLAESELTEAGCAPIHQAEISESRDPLKVVISLIAAKVDQPPEVISPKDRLLTDWHMNSITVGQIVTDACSQLGLPSPLAPMEFATSSVEQIAKALEELRETGSLGSIDDSFSVPDGIDNWIRNFEVELIEQELQPILTPKATGAWQVSSSNKDCDRELAESLKNKLESSACSSGMLVLLSGSVTSATIEILLRSAKQALDMSEDFQFVIVQSQPGTASFARTFYLESDGLPTTVITAPDTLTIGQRIELITSELSNSTGFQEIVYDNSGRRFVPEVRILPIAKATKTETLSRDDVVLVTGGGKGIASECALSLARQSGVKVILLGRSDPNSDAELQSNLKRFSAHGVNYFYARADVCDLRQLSEALTRAQNELGPISAVIHGAGRNYPKPISALTPRDFQATLAPKVTGLQNVLDCVDSTKLHLLVSFGSIISRSGLKGEADYALANEQLRSLTEDYQHHHPKCRALTLEWSVWSGAGMGERLGRIEALSRQGITPITVDQGVQQFIDIIQNSALSSSIVVSSRFGLPPTLTMKKHSLPLLRFLENPRIFYPGIELIVDCKLSLSADPYLTDHSLAGQNILPGVIGLEAMSQVASTLINSKISPVFEDVVFDRAVTLAANSELTIRVMALAVEPNIVEVRLRSESTNFQVDHFRARLSFRPESQEPPPLPDKITDSRTPPLLITDDLYGDLLFQRGRFRRIDKFIEVCATSCAADITPGGCSNWFGAFLPSDLQLGDPGCRDSALHAIQVCVPHERLVPVAVKRITSCKLPFDQAARIVAHEVSHQADEFVYDLDIYDCSGNVLETWRELRLRCISGETRPAPGQFSLLQPYVQRVVERSIPGLNPTISLIRRSNGQTQSAEKNIRRQLHRPDGKPDNLSKSNGNLSRSYCGDLALSVSSAQPVACDFESSLTRENGSWDKLLGDERKTLASLISAEADEQFDESATRVWTALECLKKIGLPASNPLTLHRADNDGIVTLCSGNLIIATIRIKPDASAAPEIVSVAGYSREQDI